jgi:hypothetical protein
MSDADDKLLEKMKADAEKEKLFDDVLGAYTEALDLIPKGREVLFKLLKDDALKAEPSKWGGLIKAGIEANDFLKPPKATDKSAADAISAEAAAVFAPGGAVNATQAGQFYKKHGKEAHDKAAIAAGFDPVTYRKRNGGADDYNVQGITKDTNPWSLNFAGTPEQKQARMIAIISMKNGASLANSLAAKAGVNLSGKSIAR